MTIRGSGRRTPRAPVLVGGTDDRRACSHRPSQCGAVRVHHRHREQALEQARQADRELAAGTDRGPLHGIPGRGQGSVLHQRSAHHGGLARSTRTSCPDHNATVVDKLLDGGRGDAGQAEHARAGLRDHVGQSAFRRGAQSVEPAAQSRRIERRIGRGGGDADGVHGDGQRYRRVRSAFRHRSAARSGSSRPTGASAGTASFPLGYSLDHMGPLTRTVRDAALALNAIAGHDPRDPSSSRASRGGFRARGRSARIRGVRIGFPESFFFEHLDEDVELAVRGGDRARRIVGRGGRAGAVPDMAALNAVARVILLAEASAVLSRLSDRREPIRRRRAGAPGSGTPGAGRGLRERAAPAPPDAARVRRRSGKRWIASSRRPRRPPRRASAIRRYGWAAATRTCAWPPRGWCAAINALGLAGALHAVRVERARAAGRACRSSDLHSRKRCCCASAPRWKMPASAFPSCPHSLNCAVNVVPRHGFDLVDG